MKNDKQESLWTVYFVFYDNVSNNFYRFTNVFVKDKDNNLMPGNCYGLNQNKRNNIGR